MTSVILRNRLLSHFDNFRKGLMSSTGTAFLKAMIIAAICCLPAIGAKAQLIIPFAGTGSSGNSGDGFQATDAKLDNPYAIVCDGAGNTYILDEAYAVVRKVDPSGIITTVAGTGTFGYSGDGGPATNAQLSTCTGLAIDPSGNLFIDDNWNGVVRKVDVFGTITTYAGNYYLGWGFSGDGGPATNAQLSDAEGLGCDGYGNLYIADWMNSRIRMVTPGGTISTVCIISALGVAGDAVGNIYIADYGNSVVRRRDAGTGTITIFAGTLGSPGYSGDGGQATNAQLRNPKNLWVDNYTGNVVITDYDNNAIRSVNTSGIITTVAGTSVAGNTGDWGPATMATLDHPEGACVDALGNVYIADFGNNRAREVVNTIPPHPCANLSHLTVTGMVDPHGNCFYNCSVNVGTFNEILGYKWSGPGMAVIHHTHANTDNYSFMLPNGATKPITVTIYLVDTSFTDTLGGPCCEVVLTDTVTCSRCTGSFDTANTTLWGFGGDDPDSCRFHLGAHATLGAGWTMVEYDWYILPSLTPAIVTYSGMPVDHENFTFLLGFTGTIRVVFKAVNMFGDTCVFSRTINLDCAGHTAHRDIAHGSGIKPNSNAEITGEFNIYPNPTDDVVTVVAPDMNITNIQVIDVNGKKVGDYKFDNTGKANVSLSSFPPGTYLLRVNNTTSKVVNKVN